MTSPAAAQLGPAEVPPPGAPPPPPPAGCCLKQCSCAPGPCAPQGLVQLPSLRPTCRILAPHGLPHPHAVAAGSGGGAGGVAPSQAAAVGHHWLPHFPVHPRHLHRHGLCVEWGRAHEPPARAPLPPPPTVPRCPPLPLPPPRTDYMHTPLAEPDTTLHDLGFEVLPYLDVDWVSEMLVYCGWCCWALLLGAAARRWVPGAAEFCGCWLLLSSAAARRCAALGAGSCMRMLAGCTTRRRRRRRRTCALRFWHVLRVGAVAVCDSAQVVPLCGGLQAGAGHHVTLCALHCGVKGRVWRAEECVMM